VRIHSYGEAAQNGGIFIIIATDILKSVGVSIK